MSQDALFSLVVNAEAGEAYTVTRDGRPVAVLIGHGEYTTLREATALPVSRILVTGSRDWVNRATIAEAVRSPHLKLIEPVTLVSGACPTGADRMAEEIAESLGWAVERYPADWAKYGRGAGALRNAAMVDLGADVCLAFIRNGSRDATMCADLAERAGIPVIRYIEQ